MKKSVAGILALLCAAELAYRGFIIVNRVTTIENRSGESFLFEAKNTVACPDADGTHRRPR